MSAPSSAIKRRQSAQGNALEKNERGKCERIVLESLFKISEIVLQSRVRFQSPQRTQKKKTRPPFNLHIENIDFVRKQLEPWKHDPYLPLSIDIFWMGGGGACAGHFSGVGIPSVEAKKHNDNTTSSRILLERWSLHFDPSGGADLSLKKYGDMTSQLRQVYKRIAIFLRSVFAFVRVLPAYGLMRNTKRSNLSTTHINYEFGANAVSNDGSLPLSFNSNRETSKYFFSPIGTPFGELKASVMYAKDCGFDLSGSILGQPNVTDCIINDYADRPEGKDASDGQDVRKKRNPNPNQEVEKQSSNIPRVRNQARHYHDTHYTQDIQQQTKSVIHSGNHNLMYRYPLRLDSPYRSPPELYRASQPNDHFRPHSLPDHLGPGFAMMVQNRYYQQQRGQQNNIAIEPQKYVEPEFQPNPNNIYSNSRQQYIQYSGPQGALSSSTGMEHSARRQNMGQMKVMYKNDRSMEHPSISSPMSEGPHYSPRQPMMPHMIQHQRTYPSQSAQNWSPQQQSRIGSHNQYTNVKNDAGSPMSVALPLSIPRNCHPLSPGSNRSNPNMQVASSSSPIQYSVASSLERLHSNAPLTVGQVVERHRLSLSSDNSIPMTADRVHRLSTSSDNSIPMTADRVHRLSTSSDNSMPTSLNSSINTPPQFQQIGHASPNTNISRQSPIMILGSNLPTPLGSTPPRHPNSTFLGSPTTPTQIRGYLRQTPDNSRNVRQQRNSFNMSRTPSDPDLHSLWPERARASSSGSKFVKSPPVRRGRSGSLGGIQEMTQYMKNNFDINMSHSLNDTHTQSNQFEKQLQQYRRMSASSPNAVESGTPSPLNSTSQQHLSTDNKMIGTAMHPNISTTTTTNNKVMTQNDLGDSFDVSKSSFGILGNRNFNAIDTKENPTCDSPSHDLPFAEGSSNIETSGGSNTETSGGSNTETSGGSGDGNSIIVNDDCNTDEESSEMLKAVEEQKRKEVKKTPPKIISETVNAAVAQNEMKYSEHSEQEDVAENGRSVALLVEKCQSASALTQMPRSSIGDLDDQLAFFDEVDPDAAFSSK